MINKLTPRFEFRAFAYDFGVKRDRLHHLATLEDIEERTDVYLLTPGNQSHNIKVRGNSLDIKYLLHKENNLELWLPLSQATFPLTASQLHQELFTSLNIINPKLEYESYGQQAFWDILIKPQPSICLAHVVKHRFLFRYGSCRAEVSNLWLNGSPLQTLAIKDEDSEIVQQVIKKLCLESYENVNYPLAIERFMHLTPYFITPHTWLSTGSGSSQFLKESHVNF